MPADFENVEEVGAHLRRLEGETRGVDWASADAVRLRGRQRGQRRAIAGTMVVCLGIATLGISITGNLPGQKGFLNTTVPIAGVPTEQRTVPEDPSEDAAEDSTTSSASEHEGSVEARGPGEDQHGGTSPDDPTRTSATPSHSRTASEAPTTEDPPTSPSEELSPTATDSTTPDPTPTPTLPTVDVTAVVATSELPGIGSGSWSELDGGSGEGAAAAVWKCAKPALDDLDARSTAWRTSEWAPGSDEDGGTLPGGAASAAFASEAVATTGYDELTGAVEDCGWGTAGEVTSVPVDSGEATWWTITKDSQAQVAGLVRRGSALAYVVFDLPDAETTVGMDATLRAAADRLAPWEN